MNFQTFWPFLCMRKVGIIYTSYTKSVVTVVIRYIDSYKGIETVALWGPGLFSWFLATFYCVCGKRQELLLLASILTTPKVSAIPITCTIEYLYDRTVFTVVLAIFLCVCAETTLSVLLVRNLFVFFSWTLISYKISAISQRFLLIFGRILLRMRRKNYFLSFWPQFCQRQNSATQIS